MHSGTHGNRAESAVLNALIAEGYGVLIPFGDGLPYDLVADLGHDGFARVQVKTAWRRGGCLIFNTLATDHGNGSIRRYEGRADIFGVHHPPLDALYLVPLDGVAVTEGRLRLEPTRNNQRRRIRLAADFEIGSWTKERLVEAVDRSRGPTHRREAA